ncbi:MAG: VWA domain-containing protein [Eubacterium sp.]|nr:VWA domain-containing protein [Eubacterium sp.]
MIFSTLLPVALFIFVPFIIILYFLRPRGKDTKISSNLLWKQLFEKTTSRTTRSRFVRDILLVLQLLIVVLLIFALMAPHIRTKSRTETNILMLIDTSAGMQHTEGQKTRLEKALEDAVGMVEDAGDTSFTILTSGGTTDIKISNSRDKDKVKKVLEAIECTDEEGSLSSAYDIVRTMQEGSGDELLHVIIFTDGSGAETVDEYTVKLDAEVRTYGGGSENIAAGSLTFSSAGTSPEGKELYNFASRITNFGNSEASFEVTLYDEDGSVLGIKSLSADAGLSATAIFTDVEWKGMSARVEVSGVSFKDGGKDSLKKDDKSYAVKTKINDIDGLLIGQGNVFIEKAFQAVTGHEAKISADDSAAKNSDANIIIYDSGTEVKNLPTGGQGTGDGQGSITGVMQFGIPSDEAKVQKKLEGVFVTVRETALTDGIGDFSLGVNYAAELEVPEWATSFIDHNGNSVGYFGEKDGIRYIVVGFDIRETDFPLKAEFPIFMADSVSYLADTGILTDNIYTAGDTLLVNPSADYDSAMLASRLTEAGVFTVSAADSSEKFVVRFPLSESDGRADTKGTVSTGDYTGARIRQNISKYLVIAAVLLMILELIIYIRGMRYRGKFYIVLRVFLALLLILSIFGVSIPVSAKVQTTVFVVDLSESNKEYEEDIDRYLSAQIRKLGNNDQYGVVAFGDDAAIDQFVTTNNSYSGVMAKIDGDATNIENAVGRALSMIPSESAGRIVIITDGRETQGNIMNTASALAGGDIELRSIVLSHEEVDDAYIENASLPDKVSFGEQFTINVTVVSNIDTKAKLILTDDSGKSSAMDVDLTKGNNRFAFKQVVDSDTSESFMITVEAEGDQNPDNNSFNVFTAVSDSPSVLVVYGHGATDEAFDAVLKAAGVNYEGVQAKNAPEDLKSMLAYESIVFDNVFVSDLPDGFMENIETYVKDYGHGFICCGGENSFMLGGYNDTVIEKILPVDMEMRGIVEIPSTAMVMIIDRSGSMLGRATGGGTYLDMALNAAIIAVENLTASDYVGVICFDDQFDWVVPIQQVTDKDKIINAIKGIKEGGGTTIKPSVSDAELKLRNVDAVNKHIILLSDGMGETTDFDDVIQRINNSGITLSTVAVGDYADAMLLQRLAKSCGGRYYFSRGAGNVPKIFTQEIYLSMNTYIQNGDFRLNASSSNAITRGLFENGWPNVLGYIAATSKDLATEVITSDQNDPILTVWQYGLGRTAAWNTDVSGAWTANLSGEGDYAAMWKRLTDYTINEGMSSADRVDTKDVDGKTIVTYKADEFHEGTEISANYVSPDGSEGTLSFVMVEPGVYQAELDGDEAGIYDLSVVREDNGELINSINTAAVLQYPKEYRFDISNKNFVDFAEKYGKIIDFKDDIWGDMKKHYKDSFDLTWIFILLALLLFVTDVTLRRLGFTRFPIRRKKKAVGRAGASGNGQAAELSGGVQASAAGSDLTSGSFGQAAAGIGGAQAASGTGGTTVSQTAATGGSEKASKKASKKDSGKKRPASTQGTGLDMSELLKKKNDRNL